MSEVRLGESVLVHDMTQATGERVIRDGEPWFCIRDCDAMKPFLMSVVSGSDHWMYVSSKGSLTCGRRNADGAIFPYLSDDRIHHAHHHTGPFTAVLVGSGIDRRLWLPFHDGPRVDPVRRNLYKNEQCDRLVFEEVNESLGLVFEQQWCSSERFGFIRQCLVRNLKEDDRIIELVDGVRNILPAGVKQDTQSSQSTLVDGYKQSEKLDGLPMALFTLSSLLTDRAEPSEALRASVAWSLGLSDCKVLLSTDQLDAFMQGRAPVEEEYVRGRRCHFLVHGRIELEGGESRRWIMAADVGLSAARAIEVRDALSDGLEIKDVEEDVGTNSDRLWTRVAAADGVQESADPLQDARHFANTLFNIMRGGVPCDEGRLSRSAFLDFTRRWNRSLLESAESLTEPLGQDFERSRLLHAATKSGDVDLQRLALEYLPLVFSRRHGDPSRPWNRFNIELKNPDGSERIYYEGNWRDIFQNWEALTLSYPEFIDGALARFVNASTADGYNPYRISSDGIDWEVLDPEDPWSHIGYWGDHQVNYLVKLLERARSVKPSALNRMLGQCIFVHADVPYRIRPFPDLLAQPRNSIEFDNASASASDQRVDEIGADGRLARRQDGELQRVNLWEKLLLSALARLGGLVPHGGIWMNTQRPEWNDANNALAGYGLSVVTLCYLRRYVIVLEDLLDGHLELEISISTELQQYLVQAAQALRNFPVSGAEVDDQKRLAFMQEMGAANDAYRSQVYAGMSGEQVTVSNKAVAEFLALARVGVECSIESNRRDDGLYHSYNLLETHADGCGISRLDLMLEGQVAVLSSGMLSAKAALDLLESLRASDLYSSEKNSYLLYPDRTLPRFLEKNALERKDVETSPWLAGQLESGSDRYLEQDPEGRLRFNPGFRNFAVLEQSMRAHGDVDDADIQSAEELYESVFQHARFTGRSGAMYKYEGLGSIYWHMVSKLLLATADIITEAHTSKEGDKVIGNLIARYRDIRDGIGLHSEPAAYGAFTTDPYSHTPGFAGVQQPGMTGQVKEDFLCRFVELGARVRDGCLEFDPCLLHSDEFDPEHGIRFTLCGTPVQYRVGDAFEIRVIRPDTKDQLIPGCRLNEELSRAILQRRGDLRLTVTVPATQLL